MSKKKLPKAITRNAGEILHRSSDGLVRQEPEQSKSQPASADQLPSADPPQSAATNTSARASRTSRKRDTLGSEAALTPPSPPASSAPEQKPESIVPKPESKSGPDIGQGLMQDTVELNASRTGDISVKRAGARRIVNRYSGYSALSGFIPIAVVDTASITAIAIQMARTLSRHYDVPPDLSQIRALVAGMIGGAAAPSLATLSLGTFLRFVPGATLIGLAISSATAAACVRGLGENLIQEFEQITQRSNGTSSPSELETDAVS